MVQTLLPPPPSVVSSSSPQQPTVAACSLPPMRLMRFGESSGPLGTRAYAHLGNVFLAPPSARARGREQGTRRGSFRNRNLTFRQLWARLDWPSCFRSWKPNAEQLCNPPRRPSVALVRSAFLKIDKTRQIRGPGRHFRYFRPEGKSLSRGSRREDRVLHSHGIPRRPAGFDIKKRRNRRYLHRSRNDGSSAPLLSLVSLDNHGGRR